MYYKRTLAKTLEKATKSFKVVLITGPRQVGKTTLFRHLKEENRTYVTLDDVEANALAVSDPELFFQTYRPPLFIDEVQRAPNLFRYIKKIVDKSDDKGLFWLTGSQQFTLMKDVSESLAGRIAILDLQGFSQSEKQKDDLRSEFVPDIDLITKRPVKTLEETFDIIIKGSYPQLFDGLTDKDLFYSSYIRTYLERDIREIINIKDELTFVKFLKILASRTSQVMNYNDIARDVGVAQNTIKSWISILQTSGLIYLLQPYFNNLSKRSIKTPKLYFLDIGLCSYLCGINSAEMAISHPMSGAMFETYVVSEVLKSYWHNGKTPQIYFYRDSLQKEIDLIIENNGKLHPIEIKQTASPTVTMTKNFSVIDDKFRGKGAIICLSNKLIPMNKDVNIIPVSYI
jgi:predicted AAA+ superfamily ATPase